MQKNPNEALETSPKKPRERKISKIKQPDYLLFIVCVSLVLSIFGIIGWMIVGSKQVESLFREKVVMHVYLMDGVNYEAERDALIGRLNSFNAVKQVIYKDKDYALREWNELGGEDFLATTKENILPESLEIYFSSAFVTPSIIKNVQEILVQNPIVSDVQYPFELFSQFKLIRQITYYLGVLGVALLIVAVVILSYLVKLIMYNNRFIIRTMSLVGASHRFISRPFQRRAVFNGFISSVIAVGIVFFATRVVVSKIPNLAPLSTTKNFVIVAIIIVLLGVLISWLSTVFTVRKYLNTSSMEKFY